MENKRTEDVLEPLKRRLVNIYLDDEQLNEIGLFQQAMLLPTRMAAIRLLLAAGFEARREEAEAKLAKQREAKREAVAV